MERLNTLMIEISKNRSIADAYRRIIESSTFTNLPEWKRNMIKTANINRVEESKTITPEKFANDMIKSPKGALATIDGKSFNRLFASLPKGMYEGYNVRIEEGDKPQSVNIYIGAFPIKNYGETFVRTIYSYISKYANWMKFIRESHGNEEVMMVYSTNEPEVINKFHKLTGNNELRTDFVQDELF